MPKQRGNPGTGDFRKLIRNLRSVAVENMGRVLIRLTARVQVWDEQFGKGDETACAAKLVEEALELLKSPRDLDEAADILIVLLAWLRPAGHSLTALINAATVKQILNEQRQWETGLGGVRKHVDG